MMACKKSFVLDTSEVEGRLDPLYYSGEIFGFFNKLNFKVVALKSISKNIISGIGAGKQDQSNKKDGILQIRPTNIDKNGGLIFNKNIYILKTSKVKLLKKDDVLFNNTNSQEWVGKTSFFDINDEMTFSNHISKIVVKKEVIESKYLYYILNVYQKNKIFFNLCTNWNNQSGVGISLLKKLKIPLPPKTIQTQIVNLMDNAYKIKEEKEKRAEELLASIDTYLLDVLGIILPQIKEETTFSLDSSEVFSGRLDPFYYKKEFVALHKSLAQSHFEIMNLQQVCEVNRGGSPRPIHEYITTKQDGLNWIKIGDTKNIDKYIYQTKQKIKKEGLKHSRFVKEGDFILSNSMSFGKPYIMRTTGCIHDGWLLLRIKDYSLIEEEFLYTILNAKLIYMFFKQVTIGSVVENLNIDLVKKIKIPIPPLDIQNEIVKHFQELRMEVNKLKQEAKEVLANAKAEVEQIILGEDLNEDL